jgi:hypothetical protein
MIKKSEKELEGIMGMEIEVFFNIERLREVEE